MLVSLFSLKHLQIFLKNNKYMFTVMQIFEDSSSLVQFLTSHKREDF